LHQASYAGYVGVWSWSLIGCAVTIAVWIGWIAILYLNGRRADARALASFASDCVVLISRLLRDERVPRRLKLLLAGLFAYLASPLDLVPDVIPGVGQIDDLLLLAFVLRRLVRGCGEPLVREHWPGPPESLRIILRVTGA